MRDLHTNKKTFTTLIVLALMALTALSAGMLIAIDDNGNSKQTASVQAGSSEKAKVQPATTIRFTAVAGKTVLEQLKQTAGDVTIKDSSYGPYVEAIDEIKGGTNNKYWTYYVNGQMANIGAGEYTTKGGEEIVWKFE